MHIDLSKISGYDVEPFFSNIQVFCTDPSSFANDVFYTVFRWHHHADVGKLEIKSLAFIYWLELFL